MLHFDKTPAPLQEIIGTHGTSSAVPFGKNHTDAFARVRHTHFSGYGPDRKSRWLVSRRSFLGKHIC